MSSLSDRLSDRISVLLQTAEATSDALAKTLRDAQDEIAAVNDACADAKSRVLDPHSTSSVVTRARKELEDHTLAASRLEAAIGILSDRLETARAREAEAARSKLYEDAKAERDALAEDIRKLYPEAAATIAALLHRIEASDQKIEAVNSDRPDVWLEPIEMVVRGRPPNEGSPLARSVRLPGLQHPSSEWNSIWPAARN